jgi:hypothetical protein
MHAQAIALMVPLVLKKVAIFLVCAQMDLQV